MFGLMTQQKKERDMKALKHFLAASVLLWGSAAWAAGGHSHSHDPQPEHGGVVVEQKELVFELVAKPDVLQLYLSEHHGEPVNPAKLTAKLTLLSGSQRQEVELLPAGKYLEAKGSFKVDSQTKVIAVVSGAQLATARFVLH